MLAEQTPSVREISIGAGPPSAVVTVPGSKSLTNRGLICAALANGESRLTQASDSDDTGLMINGLNQLGILVRRSGRDLVIEGKGGRVYAPRFPVPVGNAGTTFRFLLALAALADGVVTFDADGRMSERPVQPLLDVLGRLGVRSDAAPFAGRYAVEGGALRGGSARVPAGETSQFLSALMMVAPYAEGGMALQIDGDPVSSPYVAMTRGVMKTFGVETEQRGGLLEVRRGPYRPAQMTVEPDASAAAILLCAAFVRRAAITITPFAGAPLQGDMSIVQLLRSIGARIEQGGDSLSIRPGNGAWSGIDADLRETPDLVPPLVCTLLFASGPSRLRNIPQLKFKESDRLEILCREMGKLGARIRRLDDGIEIQPAPLSGAELDPGSDHRIAMSLAIAGLRVQGVRIRDAGCVSKSFPSFWDEFAKIEGRT